MLITHLYDPPPNLPPSGKEPVNCGIIYCRFAFLMLILISLITGACSSSKSRMDKENLIPEKDLISILTDIHIANGLLNLPHIKAWSSTLDSISSYIQVIEKHGYTKDIMDKTMNYYFVNDPKTLNRIYDQVLGILSEMESRIEKQSAVELARSSNLWRGKDFYSFPSASDNDSTMFNTTLYRQGLYTLSFSATLFPDDQTINPRLVAFTCSADSLESGKRRYLNSIEYLKDGRPHTYSMFFQILTDISYLRGWLIYFENQPYDLVKHIQIENISLTYSTTVVQ
jgi:Domain of unknown function (DUF4296)